MNTATFQIHRPTAGTMTLAQAILIYRGSPSQRDLYATVHDIGMDGATATILAGRPATRRAVLQLSRELRGESGCTELIPEQALFSDGETLVWWMRPCMRHVAFNTGEAMIGVRAEIVPHPALVFAASSSAWRVWALHEPRRPTLTTPLYRAPYFNVNVHGTICAGTVVLPQSFSFSAITAWEDAFFRSTFTHPDALTGGRIVSCVGGAYAFWRAMLDQAFTAFPADVLVPTTQQLSDILPR